MSVFMQSSVNVCLSVIEEDIETFDAHRKLCVKHVKRWWRGDTESLVAGRKSL